MNLQERWTSVVSAARAFSRDAMHVVEGARLRGVAHPHATAFADASLWVLAMIRGSQALRGALGASLGLKTVLRVVFHCDVWTDEIGPGLRLPHPFNIVIGDGVVVGRDVTIMHNVTVQRGKGTVIHDGAVLANGVTVLRGVEVGAGALIGSASVVRKSVAEGMIAAGIPARELRRVDARQEAR